MTRSRRQHTCGQRRTRSGRPPAHVPMAQLQREIEAGIEYFWSRRPAWQRPTNPFDDMHAHAHHHARTRS